MLCTGFISNCCQSYENLVNSVLVFFSVSCVPSVVLFVYYLRRTGNKIFEIKIPATNAIAVKIIWTAMPTPGTI